MHLLLLTSAILHVSTLSVGLNAPADRLPWREASRRQAVAHGSQKAPQPTPPVRPPAATNRLREETVNSAAIGRPMKYRVLLPEAYASSLRRYPVLYLLHGLGGNYTDWTMRSNLAEYTRTLPLIVVMPDGENQWYTNAADGNARFEDS